MPTTDASLFLLVGLGNPGSQYAQTRHNLGFDVLDSLAGRWQAPDYRKKFHAFFSEAIVSEKKVLLLKPQTYMNRSGLSVGEAATFFKIETAQNLLVISDDLDLPPGQIRLRLSGGAGGHNGLKSIIEAVGGEAFLRLRIGIGRPSYPDTESHVLSRPRKEEQPLYDEAIALASDAVECILKEGMLRAMDKFNRKPKQGEKEV